MQFPLLSVLIFTPLVAGIAILALPEAKKSLARSISLVASAIVLLVGLGIYFNYSKALGGYQLVEKAPWLPQFGISYHVGVDGMSLPLVVLTGLVMVAGTLVSWNITDRPREFFAFFMFLGTSVLGVFCALDLFLLFFFFELAVFPKYLMIVMWGSPQTKLYGGMKLTLYLFIGSMISLIGALAIYFGSGLKTFDMPALESAGFPAGFQYIWFPIVFLGFAILGGMFPFHSWAPDGHVAAPTATSMFLAGVEMKVGVYAALRVAIELLPEGARQWVWLIFVLATINVVYGAFIALVQKDFKYIIGFSSVSHMGLVLIGLATLNRNGLIGAGMQMFSHGVMFALFFAIVGMVYDRTHTRELAKLGGLAKIMPWAAIGFIVGGLVSMGMPGFSGFVAEFPIFMGVWQANPLVAIIAILGVIITAGYIFLTIRRVFFGELPEALKATPDVSWMDKVVIGGLSAIMILIGWFPSLMVPWIESGVSTILKLLGGA
ncbi:MAG TPA: NADH-quinone oxidoreductase subunit M [Bellilinea sp.]|nr:NADH-quinone oxidoreductase subunit M [Bellilinea sp.]